MQEEVRGIRRQSRWDNTISDEFLQRNLFLRISSLIKVSKFSGCVFAFNARGNRVAELRRED
jgi:hypothetical protein